MLLTYMQQLRILSLPPVPPPTVVVQPVNPAVPMVAGTARDLTCTINLTNVDDINVMVNFTWSTPMGILLSSSPRITTISGTSPVWKPVFLLLHSLHQSTGQCYRLLQHLLVLSTSTQILLTALSYLPLLTTLLILLYNVSTMSQCFSTQWLYYCLFLIL